MKKRYHFALILLLSAFIGGAAYPMSQEKLYKYNEEALEHIRARRYPEAIKVLKTIHRHMPGSEVVRSNLMAAYNNHGFDLMRAGDIKTAIELYEEALYYDPDSAYTRYNLGQVYYKAQNISKAVAHLREAYDLKPGIKGLGSFLEKVEKEMKIDHTFKKFETMHFAIAYQDKVEDEKVSYIKIFLEEAYGRIGMFLDHYPEAKVPVVLYPEKTYLSILGDGPQWSHGVYDGKMRIPVIKDKITDEDLQGIIYHEYAHAALWEIVRGKCPQWLSEGIACKAEDLAKAKDREYVARYINRFGLAGIRDIPRSFLRIKDPNRATWIYIQSYLLVDYIYRRYSYFGLRELLEKLAGGETIENAVKTVFNDSIEAMEEKWKRFIIDEYRISTE